MKALLSILIICACMTDLKAGSLYRNYLLSTMVVSYPQIAFKQQTNYTLNAAAYIPRFERPKGAIFCRMEDKVTKATGVWLKVGVQ
jgi:hypothetical protein